MRCFNLLMSSVEKPLLWAVLSITFHHEETLRLQPPSVFEAEMNMSLFIISSNWMFNYPILPMPSVVTLHSLHVKTSNDPLLNVSNRHSLSFLHNICRLHLSAQYLADCDNSLAVKHVCKSPLVGSFLGRTHS